MLLIKFLIYFQNIFIAQAAVMKITNLPLTEHLRSQKYSYGAIYNNDDYKHKRETKEDDPLPDTPVCKEQIKPQKPKNRIDCDPLPVDQKIYRATRLNGDAYIERKSHKDKMVIQGGGQKPAGKREAFSNLTANGNFSSNSSTTNSEFNDPYDKVSKLIHPDLDNFYDSELIRKLSDANGKLPNSLKLVIPPDKEPIIVYNESEDDSFNNRNFFKRESITPKSNFYYDYNYYEEQQSDNSKLNSGPYNIRKKNSNDRLYANEEVRSLNSSVDDIIKEINKPITLDNSTGFRSSSTASEIYLSFGPITVGEEIKGQLPKNRSTMLNNFDNNDMIAAQRKATCPPPEAPGKQGCHPGGGVPKNPIMPPLVKNGKDPEYEKLMKGETSERVIKTIVDKIHKNPSMAAELGICDFDMGELRSMFRKIRSRDKNECCAKLSGEFKCFLTWLLTMEPSRKKRAEIQREGSSSRFSTCDQYPKFALMRRECYKKPSPQYEKLVQRVEEYRDENNVK